MFAVLDFSDYAIIALIVSMFAGSKAAYSYFQPSEGARFRRQEAKLDLILTHLGLEYKEGPGGVSAEVKALADDPAKKIAAIKLHREQTGASLADAKTAVEAYMEGRG